MILHILYCTLNTSYPRTVCNDGYPAILIDIKSLDTAVCFKPFYHCKGISPRDPTTRGTAREYLISYTVHTREYNCIFKNLLNKGTAKVFRQIGISLSICETFPPRMICNIRMVVSSAWCLWMVRECDLRLQAKMDFRICVHKVGFCKYSHIRMLKSCIFC